MRWALLRSAQDLSDERREATAGPEPGNQIAKRLDEDPAGRSGRPGRRFFQAELATLVFRCEGFRNCALIVLYFFPVSASSTAVMSLVEAALVGGGFGGVLVGESLLPLAAAHRR